MSSSPVLYSCWMCAAPRLEPHLEPANLKACAPSSSSSPAGNGCAGGWRLRARGPAPAARFVAGDTLADALAVGRHINAEGISLTLDHLGENVTSLAEARGIARCLSAACSAQMADADGIEGNVSLKLTQFGLDFSEDACRANVEQLVRRAARTQQLRARRYGVERVHRTHARISSRYLHARLRRGRHGDSGLSASQREGRRNAMPAGHPRPPVQGRLSRARERCFPSQSAMWTAISSQLMKILLDRWRVSGHRHAR